MKSFFIALVFVFSIAAHLEATQWTHTYQCDMIPEVFEDSTAFNYVPYQPAGSTITRFLKEGKYYLKTTNGTSTNANCWYNGKSGVFDAGVASTIEFKIKNITAGGTYTNGLMIRDYGRGYIIFCFNANHRVFAYDNPGSKYMDAYVDSNDWSTFRVLTNVSSGNLVSADIYYLQAGGTWSSSIRCDLITDAGQAYDSISFGDFGSAWYGESYQDYFYWTQDTATLDNMDLPNALVAMENRITIITPADNNHIEFPNIKRFGQPGDSNAIIWMSYNIGVHPGGDTGNVRISTDNGDTWSIPTNTIQAMNCAEKPDGSVIAVHCWSSTIQTTHSLAVRTWSSPTSSHNTSYKSVTLPFSSSLYTHRSLILSDKNDPNKLIVTFYGKRSDRNKFHTSLLRSLDGGQNWSFLSSVADFNDADIPGTEGYCEPVLVRLADNSLLCLMRLGTGSPCVQSRSVDGGVTWWSKPVALPGSASSIDPEILLLKNGTLVTTVGRRQPGIDFFVDYSGTGNNWQKVLFPNFQGSGYYCGYTAIAETEPNVVMMITSESDFATWQYDGTNKLEKAFIRILPDENQASAVYWDAKWLANEFPESFQYVPFGVDDNPFDYYYWGTAATRNISSGIYTCSTNGTDASNGTYYYTPEGQFNAGISTTIEFKIKNESKPANKTYVNGLIIKQKGEGCVMFAFGLNNVAYAYDDASITFTPYKDGSDYSTFRCITNVDHGYLKNAQLYYKQSNGNWSSPITASFIASDAYTYDSIGFGDMSWAWAGQWKEDYFHYTQQDASTSSFSDPIDWEKTMFAN